MGLDNKRKVFSSLHTHDKTGVLHKEADTPFEATLGDVFAVWGLAFGPEHIGSLKNGDGRKLRTYVNGKEIQNPAAYVIKKNDNIVITFGTGKEKVDLNAGHDSRSRTPTAARAAARSAARARSPRAASSTSAGQARAFARSARRRRARRSSPASLSLCGARFSAAR